MNKKTKTIYVVEDNEMVQYLIAANLKEAFDCNIELFEDADSALEAIHRQVPDLMILDYTLDVQQSRKNNGLFLLKKLQQIDHRVPTIICSGQKEQSVAVELIRHGAVDYVSKEGNQFIGYLMDAVQKVIEVLDLKEELKNEEQNRLSFLRKSVGIAGAVIVLLTCFMLWQMGE